MRRCHVGVSETTPCARRAACGTRVADGAATRGSRAQGATAAGDGVGPIPIEAGTPRGGRQSVAFQNTCNPVFGLLRVCRARLRGIGSRVDAYRPTGFRFELAPGCASGGPTAL